MLSVQHFTGAAPPSPWQLNGGSNQSPSGTATTSYNANTYTVSDEANATRTMTTDGLGRLQGVNEANTYSTTYTHDAPDDLTGLTQSSQARSFAYTSLGRLYSATNPESGTIAYTYYNNGSLHTRADTANTVTTTIDRLNRVTGKSYNDGTPAVTWTYGTQSAPCSSGSSTSYSIGRLCSVANSVSTTSFTQYDPAGRVLISSQTTGGGPYPFQYTWNMLGGLLSETYPSSRVVSYTYDNGGRINTVSGTMSGASTAYAGSGANPIAYASHHALATLPLANGITETWGYNDRLQATQFRRAA